MKQLKWAGLAVSVISVVYLLGGCWGKMSSSYKTYKTYCGRCHALPDPAQLTKSIWKNSLLPDMGARLGIREAGYDPYDKVDKNERMLMEALELYPEKPLISEEDWNTITSYVLGNAPDSLPADVQRVHRSTPLTQFEPRSYAIDGAKGSLITNLQFFPGSKGVVGANANGELWKWAPADSLELLETFNTAVVSYNKTATTDFVLEMGQMHPTEMDYGVLWSIKGGGKRKTIVNGLKRPVQSVTEDLNGDGKKEIVICEFGNLAGQLSLVSENKGRYQKKALLYLAGTIRIELQDMDNDGLTDIVVLVAQGNEGVYILFQRENLEFEARQILQLNPLYGSSDFDLVDYDGDGDLDLVIAHGDNADLSAILKPYHGIRIFVNDGSNRFEEAFFYPVYGATQVEVADFDEDGDFDIAVTSFFPDFENNPKESFLYLENIAAQGYNFKAHTFENAADGRWIVMEAGDVDGDGDTDLVLGSFTYSPAYTPPAFYRHWNSTTTDLMFLENRLR